MNPVDDTGSPHRMAIVDATAILRTQLREVEEATRALVDRLKMHATYTHGSRATEEHARRGEAIAQAMLALRHAEDARMRIGKVVQYAILGDDQER